jgi:hypothetical protein
MESMSYNWVCICWEATKLSQSYSGDRIDLLQAEPDMSVRLPDLPHLKETTTLIQGGLKSPSLLFSALVDGHLAQGQGNNSFSRLLSLTETVAQIWSDLGVFWEFDREERDRCMTLKCQEEIDKG